MSLKNTLPFIIAGIFISSIFMFTGNLIKIDKNQKEIESVDAPLNQKERLLWEFMRLRDPSTGKIPCNIKQASLKYAMTLPGSINQIRSKKEHLLAESWNLRGPVNIGGRTRALALDVLDENIMIAGGVSGGMWRSEDAGSSWVKTTKPEQLQSTSCITQDIRQGKENIWYVGTGEYFNIYGGLRGDGVYKSTDAGRSWFQLESTLSNTPQSWDNGFDYVWNIVTDHTKLDEDAVYAATAVGAIVRSTDGGDTWKTVLGGFGNIYSWFTDIAITSSGVFYATLSQKTFAEEASSSVMGIYRSMDGINWTEITPEFIPPKYRRIVIAIAPSDENQVYFLAETPGSGKLTTNTRGDSLWHSIWKYIFVSGDGSGAGGIWEDRSENIPCPERIRSQFNSQGSYDLVIKVKPDDPDVVFIGGTNLYRSMDGFSSPVNTTHIGGYCWDDTSCYEIYTYTNHHADEHAINFLHSDPNVMFTGSDGGVAITYNNLAPHVEWESLNTGYYTTQFYTVAIDHAVEGSPEIIGGLQDNGTLYTNSFDINKYWANAAGADGFHCAIADSGKALYTSNNTSKQPYIKIWRTFLDENGERIIRTRVDPDGAQDMIWNTPFRLDPNDSRRMYLAGGAILWRNNNLDLIPVADSRDSTSIGWDSLSFTKLDSLYPGASRGDRISAVVVSGEPKNIVYYGTTYGRVFRVDDAHDGNPIPVEITSNDFPGLANVGCIAVNPNDASEIFVVFTNFNIESIFHSTDGGSNWVNVSGNLEEYPNGTGAGPAVYWVEILPVGEEYLYFAGTSTGLYSTAYIDGEYTVWQQEGANSIGNMMVYMLDSRELDGYVVASTFGIGMYSANFTSIPEAPQAPVLMYPENDTTGILENIELYWQQSEDAYFYQLQVAKDADFNEMVYEIDGIKDTEYKIYNLEQGLVSYYWQIISRGTGGKSIPSETWLLITATAPPDIIYPEHDADSIDIDFSFLWQTAEGADSYHLQISENNMFTKVIIDTVLTSNSFDVAGLQDGKRYYWKISSLRNGQEGIFSDKFRFKTKEIISVDDDRSIDNEVILYGNYPNPFTGYSRIKFYLAKENKISIQLYDASGRMIKTLITGIFAKGEHTYELNAKNLSQGAYYCILKTGKTKKIKQIIIIR
ncbi:T9SS type A sorting domain-containing protein [Bacteroidota bacterium]